MPLAPGPFTPAPIEFVTVAAGTYDFTADAQTLSGQLSAIASGWDGFLSDLANLAAEPADVAIDVDLAGMLFNVQAQSAFPSLLGLDVMDAGFSAASQLLNDAIAFAPAQAWQDPGAPFAPPESALTLAIPTVPAGAFVAAPNFTVGGASGGARKFVGLYNTTRVGATNFVVGDAFTLLALGSPGDDLSVNAQFNGEQLPSVDYGPFDPTGQLYITGTMAPENAGVWREDWFIAGQLMASFNFVVTGQ